MQQYRGRENSVIFKCSAYVRSYSYRRKFWCGLGHYIQMFSVHQNILIQK